MSIEIIEDVVKKKHLGQNSINGSSIHEHAANQLLFPYVTHVTTDENGKEVITKELDVDGRTELPSPAATVVLERYADYLDRAFYKGAGYGMRMVNERYKVNMFSKNRKGRNEFVMIDTAASLNPNDENDKNLLKKVQES